VRNTCYTWVAKDRLPELSVEFDEELHLQTRVTPETLAIASDDRKRLTVTLHGLAVNLVLMHPREKSPPIVSIEVSPDPQ
jgi:hypothetical protein